MVLYVDIYFLINFICDAAALLLASLVLKVKPGAPRLIAASFIGSLYAVLDAVLDIGAILRTVTAPVCLAAMTATAFSEYFGSIRKLFTAALALAASMCLLSGIFEAIIGRAPPEGYTLGTAVLFISALCVLSTAALMNSRLGERMGKVWCVCEICVASEGKRKKTLVSVMYDSGNQLRDPYFGYPVLLVSPRCLERIVGKKAAESFSGDAGSLMLARELSPILIPAVNVFGERRMIPGFLPEYVKIIKNGVVKKNKKTGKMIVGAVPGAKDFSGFDGILPMDAL